MDNVTSSPTIPENQKLPSFHFHPLPLFLYTIIIVLTTTGAFFLGKEYVSKQQLVNPPVVTIPTAISTALPTIDPMVNWRMIENNMDFSVRTPLPQNCNGCYDSVMGVAGVQMYTVGSHEDINSPYTVSENDWLVIIAKINETSFPLKSRIWSILGGDYINQLSFINIDETKQISENTEKKYNFKRLPDLTVDGQIFKAFETNLTSQDAKKAKQYFMTKDNNVYWVIFEWTNPVYDSTADQILSTFEFLD